MSELIDILLKRFWVLVLAAFFGAVAGFSLAWISPQIYRAEVLLAPRSIADGLSVSGADSALGGLAALTGWPLGSSRKDEEHFAYLASKSLKLRFIESHDLVGVLTGRQVEGPAARESSGSSGRSDATPQDALRVFSANVLGVSRDKVSGLVRITVDWTDPALTAKWASAYALHANRELASRDAREMDRQIDYIEKRLASTEQLELRQVLHRVLESHLKSRMMVELSENYAFKTIDQAIVPDEDKPIRPRTFAMVAAGLLCGLLVAVLALLVFYREQNR